MLLKTLTSIASPAGRAAKLTTFIFHRVLSEKSAFLGNEPDVAEFDTVLRWIAGQYHVLCPLEACERLSHQSLPARAAIITFDDGYADNHQNALPVLRKHGMQACFFIATGFTSGSAMFNDRVIAAIRDTTLSSVDFPWLEGGALDLRDQGARRSAIGRMLRAVKSLDTEQRQQKVDELVQKLGADAPDDLMMTEQQIKDLHDHGMTLGGHTRNHPILASIEDRLALTEIQGGRSDIESITGRSPTIFAYPNGRPGRDFLPRHLSMAKDAGFAYAFTTQHGVAGHETNPMALPRFTPWDKSYLRFCGRALQNTAFGQRKLIWQD